MFPSLFSKSAGLYRLWFSGVKMTTISTLNRVLWVAHTVPHLQSNRSLSSLVVLLASLGGISAALSMMILIICGSDPLGLYHQLW